MPIPSSSIFSLSASPTMSSQSWTWYLVGSVLATFIFTGAVIWRGIRGRFSAAVGRQQISDLEKGGIRVSRLPFLEDIGRYSAELSKYGCYDNPQHYGLMGSLDTEYVEAKEDTGVPYRTLPSAMHTPFAITNVTDIATLARRLGMCWTEFSPEEGLMKAKGSGHSLERKDGPNLILEYRACNEKESQLKLDKHLICDREASLKEGLYIPSTQANMMAFGILPGNNLGVSCIKIGTPAEIYAVLDAMDDTQKASNELMDVNRLLAGKRDAHCMYGFSDVICLAAPVMRSRGSTIIRVPPPTHYCLSLLSSTEAFIVFKNSAIQKLCERPPGEHFKPIASLVSCYKFLESHHKEWEDEAANRNRVNNRDLDFLEDVHDAWDKTTDYFLNLQIAYQFRYADLMAAHLTHAVNYWGDAWKNVRDGKGRGHERKQFLEHEGAQLYFDYLPSIVASMKAKGFTGPDEIIEDAWFTMMFRGMCWWRLHSLYPAEEPGHVASTLPSKYWGSKMKVLVG